MWNGSDRSEVFPMRNSQSFQERCVDPVEPKNQKLRAPNGSSEERMVFLSVKEEPAAERTVIWSGKAEPATHSCVCAPCGSVSCRTLVCSIVTCGLFRFCRLLPCLLPAQNPEVEVAKEPDLVLNENVFYSDIRIAGVQVDPLVLEEESSVSPSKSALGSPTFHSGGVHLEDLQNEHFVLEGPEEDVDSLITRKLLEVFSEFEINELAKCTSDSMFLRRSQEISQIISDIVHQHNIHQQEAESRLVREIIRISTRKNRKKKTPVRPPEPQRDSGNDTWESSRKSTRKHSSTLNSTSNGSLKISVECSEDVEARNLRNNSQPLHSPSSPVPLSPSSLGSMGSLTPVTSDTPLLPLSVRT
ncbi:keratinocyte differentiation factor 1 isoform X2 [Hoplias malabaricus]|uniref:keratinocyte differentiation factor 1 isoform X2 n=1 Tax=Hoplias malabaricus TaxID=27720 RepID=UPI003462EFA4